MLRLLSNDQRQVYPVRVWIKDNRGTDEWTDLSIAIHNCYSPVVFLSGICFCGCVAGAIGCYRIVDWRKGGKQRDLQPVPRRAVYRCPDKGWRAGEVRTVGRADQAGYRILFGEGLVIAVIPKFSFAIEHCCAPVVLTVVVPFCRRPAALFRVNAVENGRECGFFAYLEAVFPRSEDRVTRGGFDQRRPA